MQAFYTFFEILLGSEQLHIIINMRKKENEDYYYR